MRAQRDYRELPSRLVSSQSYSRGEATREGRRKAGSVGSGERLYSLSKPRGCSAHPKILYLHPFPVYQPALVSSSYSVKGLASPRFDSEKRSAALCAESTRAELLLNDRACIMDDEGQTETEKREVDERNRQRGDGD